MVTLELCCVVIRQLLLAVDVQTEPYTRCERVADDARSDTVASLSVVVYTEELFLEMFEDEFYQFEVWLFRFDY